MKKKEFFWSLLTVMMVAMLSVGIVSCSKDDKNDESNPSSKVIGTWSGQDVEFGSITMTFKSGGSGTYVGRYYDSYSGYETERGVFTYSMTDESSGIIIIKYNDSYSEDETDILPFEIEGRKMYIYDDDYDILLILTKE